MYGMPLVHGRGGDEPLDIDLIRIEQQANQRLRVVRIRLDVGEHDEPLFGTVGGIRRGGRLRLGAKQWATENQGERGQAKHEGVAGTGGTHAHRYQLYRSRRSRAILFVPRMHRMGRS